MAATSADEPNAPGPDGAPSDTIKQPKDWVTGEDPMTPAQAAYLRRLSEQLGESFDSNLTKAAASERIDRLREKARLSSAGRGRSRARRPSRPSE